MDALRQRHAEARLADDARNRLIEDLLQKVDDMQKTMDRNAFIMVLIDGDCMNFLNDLVKLGISGGDEAAKLLRKAVFEYFRYDEFFQHDTKIVIRVYANFRGLSKTYADMGILPNTAALSEFILGFNKAHPLCDFVDAGNHKEAADTKLKENFGLYYYDVHCKQIIFGGSADNGYASFLSSFSTDTEVSSRVRILKGPPFSFEFKSKLSTFKWTSFPTVFRDNFISKEPLQYTGTRNSQEVKHKSLDSASRIPSLPWRLVKEPDSYATNVAFKDTATTPVTKNFIQAPGFDPEHYGRILQTAPYSAMSARPHARRASRSLSSSEIENALISCTKLGLLEKPTALDFGVVKRRVEAALELPPGFWGTSEKDEWFLKSKNIIKRAVEDWVHQTGNPPPKNATWMQHYFPQTRGSVSSGTNSSPSLPSQAERLGLHGSSAAIHGSPEPTLLVAEDWGNSEASDEVSHSPVESDAADGWKTSEGSDDTTPPEPTAEDLARDPYLRTVFGHFPVYQNSKGQRVDIPTQIYYNKDVLNEMRMRPKKLCNRFYLGRCQNGDQCPFDHAPVLSRTELATLRYLARCNPCASGSGCTVGDCTNGHMCPYGERCDIKRCRFKDLHNLDTQVASVL